MGSRIQNTSFRLIGKLTSAIAAGLRPATGQVGPRHAAQQGSPFLSSAPRKSPLRGPGAVPERLTRDRAGPGGGRGLGLGHTARPGERETLGPLIADTSSTSRTHTSLTGVGDGRRSSSAPREFPGIAQVSRLLFAQRRVFTERIEDHALERSPVLRGHSFDSQTWCSVTPEGRPAVVTPFGHPGRHSGSTLLAGRTTQRSACEVRAFR